MPLSTASCSPEREPPDPARTIGVLMDPWPAAWVHGQTRVGEGTLRDRYRKTVWLKANPRRASYMAALFRERYPGSPCIDAGRDGGWPDKLPVPATAVLLYPDAIGLGFRRLETRLLSRLAPGSAVRVLNGRRREFVLDTVTRRRLLVRRLLEWTMLPEFAFTAGFLVATPALMLVDFLRGRR